ncbi:VanZ family protein [Paenibacillus enshidis]|uniref:VanZ family protein n=1 Tax=Paenibacillus enshidis TaxID=1458439 RepID=A0ABV5AT43_9BACL
MSIVFTYKRVRFIFLIYLLLIINFVILKFTGNWLGVISRVQAIILQRNMGYWNISLNPLRTINAIFDSFQYGGMAHELFYFFGNIVAFFPMGFLIPFLRKKSSLFNTMLSCLLIILVIEFTQFITCLGSADIADVILNMTGCLIGYMGNRIYYKLERTFLENRSFDN